MRRFIFLVDGKKLRRLQERLKLDEEAAVNI
jgi:hypothetical protein